MAKALAHLPEALTVVWAGLFAWHPGIAAALAFGATVLLWLGLTALLCHVEKARADAKAVSDHRIEALQSEIAAIHRQVESLKATQALKQLGR